MTIAKCSECGKSDEIYGINAVRQDKKTLKLGIWLRGFIFCNRCRKITGEIKK